MRGLGPMPIYPLPWGPVLTLPVWVLGRFPTRSSVCPAVLPLARSPATLSKVGKYGRKQSTERIDQGGKQSWTLCIWEKRLKLNVGLVGLGKFTLIL